VYLCMYVCMYVCMYACMYVYVYYVCIYVCMYVCMCVCMYVCVYYVCIYVLCIYICMYLCMYVCMYVCMYAVTGTASKVYRFSFMKLPFIALSVLRQIPSIFSNRVLHGVRSSAFMTCFNSLCFLQKHAQYNAETCPV
jgi:hypothetical protein